MLAEYVVNFILDHPNGSVLNKLKLPVKVKAIKKDNDYVVIMSARNEHDGITIETKNLNSPDEVKKLTKLKFKDSNKN